MHVSKQILILAWGLALGTPGVLHAADGPFDALLAQMPAEPAVSLVVADAKNLDAKVMALMRRFRPGAVATGFLAGITDDLPIGDWVDFSQPIGIAIPNIDGDNNEGLIWARVPEFAAKIKTLENAHQEADGVWRFPVTEHSNAFAKIVGDYVLVATSRHQMDQGLVQDGKTLAASMSQTAKLFATRDAVIHLNMERLRPMVTGSVSKMAQMAPLLAGMALQRGGGDVATVMGTISTVAEATQQFVKQLTFIDVGIAFAKNDVNVTLAFSFSDGPIRTYLGNQRPATMPLLESLPDQPYFLATGFHVPGHASPFFDYVFDRMMSAGGLGPADADGDEGPGDTGKNSLRVTKKLVGLIQGQNAIVSMGSNGLRVRGDYLTDSPGEVLALLGQSPGNATSMLKGATKGISFEKLEPRTVGTCRVEVFALKLDESNPGAATMATIYGADSRVAFGAVGDRVRFFMGSEQEIDTAFAAEVGKPLSKGTHAQRALSALPKTRNAVALVDPSRLLALVGPFLGIMDVGDMPPGPPFAASISLTGHPARVDIHIPFRAIDRIIEAVGPNEPM